MTIGQLTGIAKGNFPGGPTVIELRTHAAADMDIPPASMMYTRRIQVHLDVYLANRGCGPPNHLGDCARSDGQPGSYQFARRISNDKRASRQWIISWRDVDLDEAARILIAIDRLKWDTRSAIRCPCTTNVHTDKATWLVGGDRTHVRSLGSFEHCDSLLSPTSGGPPQG